MERWAIEVNKGSLRTPRWSWLASFLGPERRVYDFIVRSNLLEVIGRRGLRWRSLDRDAMSWALGIPYDTIPHFVRDHGAMWKPVLDDWLMVRHGYQIIAMDGWHPIEGLYLVDGTTPDGHSHVVIYKGTGLWFDSNKGAPGLRHIRRTYWLVPLVPHSLGVQDA
jgi:hypothetical protein